MWPLLYRFECSWVTNRVARFTIRSVVGSKSAPCQYHQGRSIMINQDDCLMVRWKNVPVFAAIS